MTPKSKIQGYDILFLVCLNVHLSAAVIFGHNFLNVQDKQLMFGILKGQGHSFISLQVRACQGHSSIPDQSQGQSFIPGQSLLSSNLPQKDFVMPWQELSVSETHLISVVNKSVV